MKIEYKKEYLDFIETTTSLNNKILFKLVDENVVISQKDEKRQSQYVVTAPKENFNFSSTNDDKLLLANFSEFKKVVDTFNQPDLEFSGNKICIKKDSERFSYVVSDISVFDTQMAFKGITAGTKVVNNAKLILTKDDLKKVLTYSTIANASNLRFCVEGNKLNLKIENETFTNSAEIDFEVENLTNESGEYVVSKDYFRKLPISDYTINFLQIGGNNVLEFLTSSNEITFRSLILSLNINNNK